MHCSVGIIVTSEAANHYRKWGMETKHLTHAVSIYEFESEEEQVAFLKGFETAQHSRQAANASNHYSTEAERQSYEKGVREGSGQEYFWLLEPADLDTFVDDVGL